MHVSLYVSNIQNSVLFYSAFFNQKATKVKPGYAKFVLESPSLIISFVENKEKVANQFGHLGFQVDSAIELQSRLADAKNAGLQIVEEMGVSCCYAVQDKFWVMDPDGYYHWEVYQFTEDAEFNDPRYAKVELNGGLVLEEVAIDSAETKVNACTPGGGCC
jgi:predicted enzyme related to lactoylglutathione lyase